MKPLLWLFLKFLPLWLLAMVIGFTIAWWQRGREARRQFAKLKDRLAVERERTSTATQQALESSESYSRLATEIKELQHNQQPAVAAEDTTKLSAKLAGKDDELKTLRASRKDLEKQLKALPSESEIKALRSDDGSKQKQIEELRNELQAAQEKIEQSADASDELESLRATQEDLEKQLKTSPAESEITELRDNTASQQLQIEGLRGDLHATQEKSEALQEELERAEQRAKKLLAQTTASKTEPAAKPETGTKSDSKPKATTKAKAKAKSKVEPKTKTKAKAKAKTKTKTKAAPKSVAPAAFAGEKVTQDKALGIIFPKRPRQIDDLTEISGVGPVIANRLNDFGVYRFQQIALWDEAIIEGFSIRLKTFRNRIARDNWLQQAADLHDKHHGC